MATTSVTIVFNSELNPILALHGTSDGYPEWHGKQLANFLENMKEVNGLVLGEEKKFGEIYNGIGCLAAQLVTHFKDRVGGFYLCSLLKADTEADYVYMIIPRNGELDFVVINPDYEEDDNDEVLFRGSCSEFLKTLD